jgi:DNA polymerase III epsilon subunit
MWASNFAVVDVETTGLSPAFGERVCEIAIVHWQDGKEVDAFSTLVNPERPISPGAASVNGMTDAMVANAPLFRDVAPEICQRLTGQVFVAHNAPFDLGFLGMEFRRLGESLPVTQVVDTLDIARRYYTFPSNSLGALAEQLDIPYPYRHRALQDARISGQVLQVFLQDLARRKKVTLTSLLQPVERVLAPEAAQSEALPPLLQEALTRGLSLEIRYMTSGRDASLRRVDPLAVVSNSNTFYLRAYCHLRQEERTFRLDRITEMKIVEKKGVSAVVTLQRRRTRLTR